MYHLSKFCRICIKSSGELKDIDAVDYDSIKFSEKLKVCTRMVINKGSLTSSICTSCINKLRISYEFDNMCKKSTIILQGYLSELMGGNQTINENVFSNAELYVQLSKVPQQRKQRSYVTKEQRCSLLKELLTKIKDDKKHFRKKNNFRIKTELVSNDARGGCVSKNETKHKSNLHKYEGLKTLINFTKFYNYGYKINEREITNVKFDRSSLDKLAEFVNNFFSLDVTQYHDSIQYVLEQTEEWVDDSDTEDMFKKPPVYEDVNSDVKFEEVIVEPDINIKKEVFLDECEGGSSSFHMGYQATNYSDSYGMKQGRVSIKIEPEESVVTSNTIAYLKQNCLLAEIIPIHSQHASARNNAEKPNTSVSRKNAELYPVLCQSLDRQSQSTLDLLQEYTEQKFRKHRKPFSQSNAKCRTKDLPFISPQLKRQFLHQDFKCTVCNRRFKSQGYLQAHFSKMKHKPR